MGYERPLTDKQPHQDLDLCDNSFARYSEACFTKIYGVLYGDAIHVGAFQGALTLRR